MNCPWISRLFHQIKRSLRLVIVLSSILFLGSVAIHTDVKGISIPVSVTNSDNSVLMSLAQPVLDGINTEYTPFLHIVPSADGNEVRISLDHNGPLEGTVFANLIGPTGHKSGWTLPYSTTAQSHVRIIPFASSNAVGRVNITTTKGLNSADIRFKRAFVQPQQGALVTSVDNSLRLELQNAGTLATATYMVVTTNIGQPGPLNPTDLTLLGPSYSIRRAGQREDTDKPMTLNLSYAALDLRGADWRTLDIYRWDGADKRWLPLGAEHLPSQQAFSVRTNLFGTYVLASRPRWLATFADPTLSVLDGDKSQVKRAGTPDHFVLTLNNNRNTGRAISVPITPSFGLESWGTLVFTATTAPPTATLTVDILDVDRHLIRADVASGQSLADLDPTVYPALRLRVNMTATAPGALPTLAAWQLTWQPPRPAAFQVGSGSLAIGGLVTVPVALIEAPSAGLSGATLAVTFDPTVLAAPGCTVTARAGVLASCNPAAGDAPGEVQLSLLVSPALTSAVELAELTFRAIGWAEGGSALVVTAQQAVNAAGEPLAVIEQGGQVTFTNTPTGDVNCDDQTNQIDAMLMLEYSVNLQQAGTSCPPPAGAIFVPHCDITGDTLCDLRDAQRIWQSVP